MILDPLNDRIPQSIITGSKDFQNVTSDILFRLVSSFFLCISEDEAFGDYLMLLSITTEILKYAGFGSGTLISQIELVSSQVEMTRFGLEKDEQPKKAAIISAESHSKTAELTATTFEYISQAVIAGCLPTCVEVREG
ncbi:hypothetical protein A6R68_13782, partial [Neotoma lepida]